MTDTPNEFAALAALWEQAMDPMSDVDICDVADDHDATILRALRIAEVAGEVEGALAECVEDFALVERLPIKDPQYGDEVEALGERIGYGALMSSAQASWRASQERLGFPVGGEFVAGPCYVTAMKALRMARTALTRLRKAREARQ